MRSGNWEIVLTDLAASDSAERVRRYRYMAGYAEKQAAIAPSPARESYLALAAQWRRLAEEAEKPPRSLP